MLKLLRSQFNKGMKESGGSNGMASCKQHSLHTES
jgi:hypothetical protein